MRKVDRSEFGEPSSLASLDENGISELERARVYYATPRTKSFSFAVYKKADVKCALERLFHGKCAYCEARYDVTEPVDVEHYRPKGPAQDDSHQGYWWLAATWSNLLPCCIDCNRKRRQPTAVAIATLEEMLEPMTGNRAVRELQTGKESSFPIKGTRVIVEPSLIDAEALLEAEEPLLLDPCRDEPSQHIVFHIDRSNPIGIVYPRSLNDAIQHLPAGSNEATQLTLLAKTAVAAGMSDRGAVSIQVYGLNRLRLVQERTRVLRKLEFLGKTIQDISGTADDLSGLRGQSEAAECTRIAAVNNLRNMVYRTMAEVQSMAGPEAPFSAMVRAWIDRFKATL